MVSHVKVVLAAAYGFTRRMTIEGYLQSAFADLYAIEYEMLKLLKK